MAAMLPADAPAETRHSTHGRALPGMVFRILDPATGEPLGPDALGEIAVKGATLMRGYYKVNPERCFDESGFFRTQDGGRIDTEGPAEGTLVVVLGRPSDTEGGKPKGVDTFVRVRPGTFAFPVAPGRVQDSCTRANTLRWRVRSRGNRSFACGTRKTICNSRLAAERGRGFH